MKLWVLIYIQYIPTIIYIWNMKINLLHHCIQHKNGVSTFRFVNVLVCRRFGLSTFWFVDVLVCRRFGLSTFRFVDVLVCRRFGLSTFWSIDVSVCRRFGLSTFWFVDVLDIDVSVCRRFDQLPISPGTLSVFSKLPTFAPNGSYVHPLVVRSNLEINLPF